MSQASAPETGEATAAPPTGPTEGVTVSVDARRSRESGHVPFESRMSRHRSSSDMISASYDDGVIREGWLQKQGNIVKNWVDYFFRLQLDSLDYYVSETAPHFKGTVQMQFVSDVCNVHYADHEFCISIRCLSGTVTEVSCRTATEQRLWFHDIWRAKNLFHSNLNRHLLTADNGAMKVFPEREIEKIFQAVLSSQSENSLRENLKILKNCTEYMTEAEVASNRERFAAFLVEAQTKHDSRWTRAIQRIADQILTNLSPEGFRELQQKNERTEQQIRSSMSGPGGAPVALVCNVDLLYNFGRTLGSGTFSEVIHAEDRRTNEQVAIKCIKKNKLSKDDVLALHLEVDVMIKLKNHPNIINFIGFYQDQSYYYLVEELCTGGELFNRIIEKSYYGENDARKISRTIVATIAYCHAQGIVHRDLKPENILLAKKDDFSLKLADFGFARQVQFSEKNLLHTACGSPGYVAPEIIQKLPYTVSVDMWSIGVIVYVLLCGYPPFHADNQATLFSLIKKGKYHFDSPYWDNVSEDAKDFVSKLLVVAPEVRSTAMAALNHPWLDEAAQLPEGGGQLKSATQLLKQYTARRRFKVGIKAVMSGVHLRKVTLPASGVRSRAFSTAKDLVEPPARIPRKAVVFVSTLSEDCSQGHLLRASPDLLSPVLGSIASKTDVSNIYGWWLKLSPETVRDCSLSPDSPYWVLGRNFGHEVFFEREVALIFKSKLPLTSFHILFLDLETHSEVGRIPGGETILGLEVVEKESESWLYIYPSIKLATPEGWTLIRSKDTVYLEKSIEPISVVAGGNATGGV